MTQLLSSDTEMNKATSWRDWRFIRLWIGQGISEFGSQITVLALPLTAVVLLHANAFDMGLLTAVGLLPYPLLALFAGVWTDRWHRKPILVITDLGRGCVLVCIPLFAFFHLLSIELLYVVALLVGMLTVFFDIAYSSFLPDLVERKALADTNAKLTLNSSVAGIVGPGLGGVLVQLLTAPLAILFDAVSFFISALFVSTIKPPQTRRVDRHVHEPMLAAIKTGIRAVAKQRFLRAAVVPISLLNLFDFMIQAIIILYAVEQLRLSSGTIGLVVSFTGVGAVLGSLLSSRLANKVGLGPAILIGVTLFALGPSGFVLASRMMTLITFLFLLAYFLIGCGATLLDINVLSLRQIVIPSELQGRAGSCIRLLNWGAKPVGSLLGGLLGSLIGLPTTLWIAVVGSLLAALLLWCSSLRHLSASETKKLTEVSE